MILRLSDSVARGLMLIFAVLLALSLSFFAIRAATAEYFAERETADGLEHATRLEPRNPEYWFYLGHLWQFSLEQPDPNRAQQSLQNALRLDPYYADAWLDLAASYELEGNFPGARDAYQHAVQSYPASAEVRWRYGNYLLRQAELPNAYAELRRAIQTEPRRGAAAFSRVYRANPNLDELLDRLLPPEPRIFVSVLNEALGSGQVAVAQTVWLRLLALRPHLDYRDFDPLVSTLLNKGEWSEARRTWEQGVSTMNLPPLLRPQGSVVWDPSFESGENGRSLSWQFRSLAQGVRVMWDSEEKLSGNQSLRLSFDGKHNPNIDAACINTIVDPGVHYLFSGWIKAREITTEQGLGFRLHPLHKNGTPGAVLSTREVHGSTQWTLVDESWTAPADVHVLQVCVARNASDDPDVRISGDAWIDDVNVVPSARERLNP